jgi:hypothetical protein
MLIEGMSEEGYKVNSLYSVPPPIAKAADHIRAIENCSTRIYNQEGQKSRTCCENSKGNLEKLEA